MFRPIRVVVLGVSVFVSAVAAAQATPLTLNFSGNINLTQSGGGMVNPFSGFFTWETTKVPNQTDAVSAEYALEGYQFILNGVDRTLPPGNAGIIMGDNGDLFSDGNLVDAFLFIAGIQQNVTVNGVTGDTLLVLALYGPPSPANGKALPTNFDFLSSLPNRFAAVSLEVPGLGDANDVTLGEGTFTMTPVPEPATLTLTALGLAGVVARARRARQRRDS